MPKSLTLGTLVVKVTAESEDYQKELNKAEEQTKGFGLSMDKMVAGAAVGAFAIAANAARQFAAESLEEFKVFETGMAEVFTLLPGMTQGAMASMSNDVLAFSSDVGRVSDEVIPALYQAISAGVPQDSVFDFLTVASDAALGGVTDLETAVDGITSVVNAYGEEMLTAGEASDLMFTAVRGGKTTFEELSASLFNVIPTAASVGVEFGNITAALATMTAQGVPTSVATTQLRQLLVELASAGTDVADAFEEAAGMGFPAFIEQGGNLYDALQLIDGVAADMGVSIRDLFGSVEAGSAALALTGNNATTFAEKLDDAANSAGATEEAAATMEGTLARQEAKLEAVTEALKTQIGEGLRPAASAWISLKTAIIEALLGPITMGNEMNAANIAVTEMSDRVRTAEDALTGFRGEVESTITGLTGMEAVSMEITSRWQMGADNAEDLEIQLRALQIALEMAQAGFAGTSQELADMALQAAMAEINHTGFRESLNSELITLEVLTPTLQGNTEALEESGDAALTAMEAQRALAEQYGRTSAILDEEESALVRSRQQAENNAEAKRRVEEANRAMEEAEQALIAALEAEQAAIAAASKEMAGYFTNALPASSSTNELALAMYDAAAAAGAGPAALAALAGAYGLYSQETLTAAMNTALVQMKIEELGGAYARGEMNLSTVRTTLLQFTRDLEENGTAAEVVAGNVDALAAVEDPSITVETNFEEVSEEISRADQILEDKLTNMEEQAGNLETEASDSFSGLSETIGTEVDAAAEAVTTAMGEIEESTATALGAMLTTADENLGQIPVLVTTYLSEAVSTAAGYRDDFMQVGYDLADGMAAGIRSGKGPIVAAVYEIVDAALEAAEERADTGSPSQEMYKFGIDFWMGLFLATQEMGDAWEDQTQQTVGNILEILEGLLGSDVMNTLINELPKGLTDWFTNVYLPGHPGTDYELVPGTLPDSSYISGPGGIVDVFDPLYQEYMRYYEQISEQITAANSQAQRVLLEALAELGFTPDDVMQWVYEQIGIPEGFQGGGIDKPIWEYLVDFIGDKGLWEQIGEVAGVTINEITDGFDFMSGQFGGALSEMEQMWFDFMGWMTDLAGDFASAGGFFADLFQEQTINPMIEEMDALAGDILSQWGITAEQLENDFDNILAVARSQGYDDLVASLLQWRSLQGDINEETERLIELQQHQADLAFLQQQLELLQTIREAGLDPAEILEGITLGLDASLPDLIDAMNRVLAELIGTVEEELEIDSPSGVAERWAWQMAEGWEKGWDTYSWQAPVPDFEPPEWIGDETMADSTGGGVVLSNTFVFEGDVMDPDKIEDTIAEAMETLARDVEELVRGGGIR